MILTINDLAPLSIPAGTEVEYRGPGHNHLNVEVRVPGARHSLFLSPKWLDGWEQAEPERVRPRALRRHRSVIA